MLDIAGFMYFLLHGLMLAAPYLLVALAATGIVGVAAYCLRPIPVRTDEAENKENDQSNKE